MRGHKTLIQEAEALAMSPDAAYSFLKQRAGISKGDDDPFDAHAEANLMARADPLIDLALAQYSRYGSTAAALFGKAAPESPVRLALLTNKSAQAEIFVLVRFPVSLFVNAENAATWIAQASNQELEALFENPTLDDSFLRDVLKRSKPWDMLDDNKLSYIVAILTRNERMRTPRTSDSMDGWAEYSYGAVFDAAWNLAGSVDPSEEWSLALGWLYDQLETDAFSIKEPLSLAARWTTNPADAEAVKEETEQNERGWLTNRQRVRKGLGRLALASSPKLLSELLSSDDMAIRSAAYSDGKITLDQLNDAFTKDGELFFNEAIDNSWLWRTTPTRQALQKAAWSVVSKDKHSCLSAASTYNGVRRKNQNNHPDWFKDEDWVEVDEDAVAATKGDLALLTRRLEQPAPILVLLAEQAKQGLQTLNSRTGWIWAFSLGTLVLGLRHL